MSSLLRTTATRRSQSPVFRSQIPSYRAGLRAWLSSLSSRTPLSSLRSTTPALTSLRVPPIQRRHLSSEHRAIIQKAVDSSPVVLFMKGTPERPECGFSRAVVQILGLQGVPMEKLKTYNVLEDQDLRGGIKEFSEWPTIPQVYVNGEFVGGCDIVLGMHQSGELETLLENKNIIPKVEAEASTEPAAA